MWPYWLLFLLAAWRATIRLPLGMTSAAHWSDWWRLMFVLLLLMVGLRHEVGGDWGNYLRNIQLVSYETLTNVLRRGDPAYGLLNWMTAQLDLGAYFVNTVCAAIFAWGLVVFCRAQPLPWLALVVAVPYLVTVVAMGYTRQGVAIGLAMLGMVALADRKILRFVVFVALAATFHKSAVILMPLAVLGAARHRAWSALLVGLASLLFYVLLLQDSVEELTKNYVDDGLESSGAAIRVAMNAVPAMLFLWFRQRFIMSANDRIFWTWMSLGALAFIALLVVSPSSTAVDRMALYWIPLQLFVLSRLPDAMTRQPELNIIWIRLVIAYSAAVLFVWLSFATHAFAWLPYQFYPWVWFWQ